MMLFPLHSVIVSLISGQTHTSLAQSFQIYALPLDLHAAVVYLFPSLLLTPSIS